MDKEKRDYLDKALNGDIVFLHVSTSHPEVSVPEYLRNSPTVTLQVSRNFNYPPELEDKLVKASLLFNGQYFDCVVPYEAIWAMSEPDGTVKLWEKSLPEKIIDFLRDQQKDPVPEKVSVTSTPKAKPTHLKRVK